MDGLGTYIGDITSNWGPAALLSVATVMLLTGLLVPKRTMDKLLTAKDERYKLLEISTDTQLKEKDEANSKILKTQQAYYEGRLSDTKVSHDEIITEIRKGRDSLDSALAVAVENNTKLIVINEESQELARTVSSALLGARAAVEKQSGDGRKSAR